jgi:E3 ubiquitin-protein ligase RGLG
MPAAALPQQRLPPLSAILFLSQATALALLDAPRVPLPHLLASYCALVLACVAAAAALRCCSARRRAPRLELSPAAAAQEELRAARAQLAEARAALGAAQQAAARLRAEAEGQRQAAQLQAAAAEAEGRERAARAAAAEEAQRCEERARASVWVVRASPPHPHQHTLPPPPPSPPPLPPPPLPTLMYPAPALPRRPAPAPHCSLQCRACCWREDHAARLHGAEQWVAWAGGGSSHVDATAALREAQQRAAAAESEAARLQQLLRQLSLQLQKQQPAPLPPPQQQQPAPQPPPPPLPPPPQQQQQPLLPLAEPSTPPPRTSHPALPQGFFSIAPYVAHLRSAAVGLTSSQLVIFVDCTSSNKDGASTYLTPTGARRSLHDTSDPAHPNPYCTVMRILGTHLEAFDDDRKIPLYGFGDFCTRDRGTFAYSEHAEVKRAFGTGRFADAAAEAACNALLARPGQASQGIAGVLELYRQVQPKVDLHRPTSFAGAVERCIDIAQETGEFTICLIIADGAISREGSAPSKAAVVRASEYPIAIITVGVGDGEPGEELKGRRWEQLQHLDEELPGRRFDNFIFVEHDAVRAVAQETGIPEDECFALMALKELPDAYRAVVELGLLGGGKGQ